MFFQFDSTSFSLNIIKNIIVIQLFFWKMLVVGVEKNENNKKTIKIILNDEMKDNH